MSDPSPRSCVAPEQRSSPSPVRRFTVGVGVSLALGACFTGSEGLNPPTLDLYFPTGIVVSPGRTTLYVANSDFDLQYNGGTVQALNLGRYQEQPGLRDQARAIAQGLESGLSEVEVCALVGSAPNPTRTLHPGPCEAIDSTPFVRAYATIGAFTSGLSLLSREDGQEGARLFAAVRGDPSVTYFDVRDDRDPGALGSPCGSDFCLSCQATGDEQRCDASHRVGENIFTSQRGLLLPTEPTTVAIAAHPQGDAVLTPHQTTATAGLVVNRWPVADDTTPFSATPSLEFLLEGLNDGPTGAVAIPPPKAAGLASVSYRPGFVVGYRNAATLSVLRYHDDAGATPPRPFLVRDLDVAITLSNDGSHSRGLTFDTTLRDACEAGCGADDESCLLSCLEVPVGFYVASRSPSSLLIGTLEVEPIEVDGQVTGFVEKLSLDESEPMPIGPSQVSVGRVVGLGGELETRIFVVDFDSRFVTVYDPVLRDVEAMIRTGRGPSGLAFDTGLGADGELESFMYLSIFNDSYLTVIDLDARRASYLTPILNVGPPLAPRGEQ